MLVKIMNYAASTGNPWELNVVLESAVGTPIDLTSQTAPSATLFKLVKATNTEITITGVTLGTTPANGEIVITFAETDATVGDVLILTQGTTVGTAPYSRIMNSASIDTGVDVSTDNLNQYILTPNLTSRTSGNYTLNLNFLQENGDDLTNTLDNIITLTTPITIYGIAIHSIKIEMVTAGDLGTNKYNANTSVQFKVTFYQGLNGTDPINFAPGQDPSILSVSFIPA